MQGNKRESRIPSHVRHLYFSVLIALLVFVLFVFGFTQNEHQKNQKEVEAHGDVVSEHIWNLDGSSSLSYLRLAIKGNHYHSLKILQLQITTPFLELNGEELDTIEVFLVDLNLIQLNSYSADINYKGKKIGVINVKKWSRSIFIYAYVFLIELLLLIVYNLYRRIAWVNRRLEHVVDERTSELVQLKEQLSSIINAMQSSLISVDEQGEVVFWNQRTEKLSGIKAEDAKGRELGGLLPELFSDMGFIFESMKTFSPAHRAKVLAEINNQASYLDFSVFPIQSQYLTGAVIRIDDVTKRVRLEETMVQTEKMLSVGGLAAGMAHEINNPLAAMMQNIQVIKRRAVGGMRKNDEVADALGIDMGTIEEYLRQRDILKMMDGILESGTRASKIITNMLSFSRKSESKFIPHEMGELVDQTIELAYSDYSLKKQYDFKQINIIRTYEEDLEPVFCEKSQIQQVLLNLLKNGAHAMAEKIYPESEKPTFIINLKQRGDDVLIEIEDNGPGIPEDVRKRIFEPFFTTKPTGVGTGLGLSVSFFIITENHGGSMEVHSQFGKGTRFILQLPYKESES